MHPSNHPVTATWALVATTLLAVSGPAAARLGGDVESINADSQQLRGALYKLPLLEYERHDIRLPSGTVVHEYLSRGGKVFAVSWQGPLPPDLRQLFGDYFESFRSAAAAQSHPGGHRQLQIAQDDLVVQSQGRLGAFRGMAFVPSLLPGGIDVAQLP